MNQPTRAEAALEVLRTYDALTASYTREPDADTNPHRWHAWRLAENAPAYDAWDQAFSVLALLLDTPDMLRQPDYFRPVCEAIIARDSYAGGRRRMDSYGEPEPRWH